MTMSHDPQGEMVSAPPPEPKQSSIHRIVTAMLTQPLLAFLLVVAVVGGGIFAFRQLPVDAYPDISPPMVEIITQWPGQASEEVERLVTVPIETGMNGVPHLSVV